MAGQIAGTWLGHVREQAGDALLARDWWSFGSQLSTDRQEALRLRPALAAHRVVIPDVIEPSLIEGLRQAKDRLSESGKLGMFAGTRRASGATVHGQSPAAEHC